MNATTPIWYTEKPKFEEVKGIFILVEYDDCGSHETQVTVLDNTDDYEYWFDDKFIRFAILDLSEPEPEPVELWGIAPDEVVDADGLFYYAYAGNNHQFILPSFKSLKDAILAWNKIATALQSIEIGGEE